MSTNIVEVFLPVLFPDGSPVPTPQLDLVRLELLEQFGGVTSFDRAPAQGLWRDASEPEVDAMTVLEVMTPKVDKAWWKTFRQRMEKSFRQKELLIRAHEATRL